MGISYSVGQETKAQMQARMGYSSGGGGTSALQGIIKQMQAAQKKANLMNEQRYQKILGSFENLGKAGRARIEQQTTQRQAQATQNLTSRGLGNTTITSAVERGIAGDAETQRQQLEESVMMQKAGVMERRTDEGPDLGMFASLLQSAGQQQSGGRSVIGTTGPGGPGTPTRWETEQAAANARAQQRKLAKIGASNVSAPATRAAPRRTTSSSSMFAGASVFRPGGKVSGKPITSSMFPGKSIFTPFTGR